MKSCEIVQIAMKLVIGPRYAISFLNKHDGKIYLQLAEGW